MATLNFDIREVLKGMKALNAMKADIKSLLHLLLPYLSDWAQVEVNKAARNNGNPFRVVETDLLDFADDDNYIVFRCREGNDSLFLSLMFRDNIGEDKVILTAKRLKTNGGIYDQVFKVEALSKWDVIPCFDFMQQMLLKLGERYPNEIVNEVAPFLEATSRK